VTTARTITREAMEEIGACGFGETPEPSATDLAFRRLNDMLDAWRNQQLLAYHIGWQSVALTPSTQTRTIGTGGQINVTRPTRIDVGSYVVVGSESHDLKQVTRDEWASISEKTLGGDRPYVFYYEPSSPLGVVHFWPQGTCTAYLAIPTILSTFADLSTEYTLPPGYKDAIVLSLAEKLCRPFSRPIPVTLRADAGNARNLIKRANLQVPQLDMPDGRRVRGSYADFLSGA
jgi:hypothetical protein